MANQKLRQEINIINREHICPNRNTDLPDGRFYYDPADYTSPTVYLEVVAKNLASSSIAVELHDASHASKVTLTIPAYTNNYTRVRSSSFTISSASTFHLFIGNQDGWDFEGFLLCVRLVILQDAATITKTATYAEIGSYELVNWASTLDNNYPKYWFYDASQWNPTPTAECHFTFMCEDDKDPLFWSLERSYNFITWTAIESGSTAGTDGVITHDRTSIGSFTLSDKAWYRFVYYSDDTKDPCTVYNVHIVIKQSDAGGIIQCVPEYLMINYYQTSTGDKDFYTYYDPAEWNDESGYTHFVNCMDCDDDSANVIIEDNGGTPLDGSSIEGLGNAIDQQSFSTYPPITTTVIPGVTPMYADSDYEAVSASYMSDGGKCIGMLIGGYKKVSATGNVDIQLHGDSSNQPGSELTDGQIDITNFVSGSSASDSRFHCFLFDTGYDTPGTQLHLALMYNAGDASNYFAMARSGTGSAQLNRSGDAKSTWNTVSLVWQLLPIEAMDMPTAQNLHPNIVTVGTTNLYSSRILVFYKYIAETTYYEDLIGLLDADALLSATVNRIRGLDGDILGDATLSATLKPLRSIDGTILSEGGLAGTLRPYRSIDGTIYSQATYSGTINRIRALVGSLLSQAVLTGNIEEFSYLVGLLSSSGSLSAALSVERDIIGSLSAEASLSGSIDILISLIGTILAEATTSASLKPLRSISGSINAQATLSGILEEFSYLVGLLSGSATLAADLHVNRDLIGSVSVQGSLTGSIIKLRDLIGTLLAQASFSATPEVLRSLIGTMLAEAVLSGTLTTGVIEDIIGTLLAQGTLAGDLAVQRDLSGLVSAGASLSGTLHEFVRMTGVMLAEGTLAATPEVLRSLVGAVIAEALLSGTLELGVIEDLIGLLSAAGTLSGSLSAMRSLGGVLDAEATLTGALKEYYHLIGSVGAEAVLDALLKIERSIVGTIDVQSSFSGVLKKYYHLIGSASAQVVCSAIMKVNRSLIGSLESSSQLNGILYTLKSLMGTIEAEALCLGSLQIIGIPVIVKRYGLLGLDVYSNR